MKNRVGILSLVIVAILSIGSGVSNAADDFNVRDYHAVADGNTLDTSAIQKAIDQCAAVGGGRVILPPGKYLSGTVCLKSNVTLFIEAGATLIGTKDLNEYRHPIPPASMPEAKWGKWHRALILAENAENIAVAGQGTIDGNKVFDPTGEEKMRGPHTFVFVNSKNVTVRDVLFLDAANYAIFFMVSDNVDIRNARFVGGWDGVHFRGAPDRDCKNVTITACEFYTGDDSIAGRYWLNTLIADCIVNSSCNGIRLIGPAKHLIIHDCLFFGPGRRPHRTSNRHNMLAGINLQPGAWDATKGNLDDVLISDITMHKVAAPFHFSLKPGNTAGTILVDRVTATGVYRAAASVESWAQQPFKNVVFRDVTITYEGGVKPKKTDEKINAPGVDARTLPAWGFFARNIDQLQFDNVRLRYEQDDFRPVLIADRIETLTLRDFDYQQPPDAPEPLVMTNVKHLRTWNTKKQTKE
ncbi:MAG: right-handed parallel beta-helix repeat-containing protein [Sedimentisphaerales bacterium]|nr:right-handed parallel beta-helix repeat-containing protein [Sedimentisphaerales bacterium]